MRHQILFKSPWKIRYSNLQNVDSVYIMQKDIGFYVALILYVFWFLRHTPGVCWFEENKGKKLTSKKCNFVKAITTFYLCITCIGVVSGAAFMLVWSAITSVDCSILDWPTNEKPNIFIFVVFIVTWYLYSVILMFGLSSVLMDFPLVQSTWTS